MSLKGFHIFFISVASLTNLGYIVWLFRRSGQNPEESWTGMIALAVLLSLALGAYFIWFLKKIKKPMMALALPLLLASNEALACAVCFGPTDKKIVDAINSSVLFLMGVVIVVLAGITWMVWKLVKASDNQPG